MPGVGSRMIFFEWAAVVVVFLLLGIVNFYVVWLFVECSVAIKKFVVMVLVLVLVWC